MLAVHTRMEAQRYFRNSVLPNTLILIQVGVILWVEMRPHLCEVHSIRHVPVIYVNLRERGLHFC